MQTHDRIAVCLLFFSMWLCGLCCTVNIVRKFQAKVVGVKEFEKDIAVLIFAFMTVFLVWLIWGIG